jgi:hypothetical protein
MMKTSSHLLIFFREDVGWVERSETHQFSESRIATGPSSSVANATEDGEVAPIGTT